MARMLPTTEFALLSKVAAEQARGRAPSLVAAVVREGRLIWSGARGFVDGVLPDNDTQYRIGSITKSLTAVLVMRLRDEGRLELDDRIEQHLGSSPYGHLTVAQLLAHTGGVTSESPGSWWERAVGGDWPALDKSITTDELKLRAGKQFHYSNVGYGMLGELAGRMRGTSWLDALHAEILGPLEMTRTSPHPDEHAAQGWAVHPFADVVLPEPAPDAGAMAPAGQLWSTVNDLARWTSFVGGETAGVLAAETVAEMREVATVEDGDSWVGGFGLGLQLVRRDGHAYAGHTGSMPGFIACSMVDGATGTGALAMANTTAGVPILGMTLDLIAIADQHEPALATPWQPADVDSSLLELAGLWHWGPTPFHLRLLTDGWIDLSPAGEGGRRSRFRPTGQDTWVGLDGYYAGETLHVGRTADGKPQHLDLATFIFTRTPYDPAAPIPGGVDPKGWQ